MIDQEATEPKPKPTTPNRAESDFARLIKATELEPPEEIDGVLPWMLSKDDPTNLRNWLPVARAVAAQGLCLVPDTEIHEAPDPHGLYSVLDGNFGGAADTLAHTLMAMGARVAGAGQPFFLRTGLTSAKHGWSRSCFIQEPTHRRLLDAVYELSEMSAMADFAFDTWVVRKLIPTAPEFTAFSQMPINREFRVFVSGDRVAAPLFYWPEDAFESRWEPGATHNVSRADWRERLAAMREISAGETADLQRAALAVAAKLPGAWSVDFMLGADGQWWLIDMAVAHLSWGYTDGVAEALGILPGAP